MTSIVLTRSIVNLLSRSLKRRIPKGVAVIIVGSVESRKLNRIYRKKNRPANVLSFRYDKNYGEIIVCPEVIRKEAKKQGNTYKYQMTWMILHGMIHLAGIHHETSKVTEKQVAQLEHRVLRKLFGSFKSEIRNPKS